MKTSTRCVGSWDRRESLEIEEMVMTQNGDSIAECEPQLVPDFRAYGQPDGNSSGVVLLWVSGTAMEGCGDSLIHLH